MLPLMHTVLHTPHEHPRCIPRCVPGCIPPCLDNSSIHLCIYLSIYLSIYMTLIFPGGTKPPMGCTHFIPMSYLRFETWFYMFAISEISKGTQRGEFHYLVSKCVSSCAFSIYMRNLEKTRQTHTQETNTQQKSFEKNNKQLDFLAPDPNADRYLYQVAVGKSIFVSCFFLFLVVA